MTKTKRKKKKTKSMDQEMFLYFYAIIMITVALIGLLKTGPIGEGLTHVMLFLFGTYYAVIYALILFGGIWIIFRFQLPEWDSRKLVGVLLALAGLLLWTAIPESKETGTAAFSLFWENAKIILRGGEALAQGGLFGAILYCIVSSLVDIVGTWLIIAALFVLAFLLLVSRAWLAGIRDKLKSLILMPFQAKGNTGKPRKPVKQPTVEPDEGEIEDIEDVIPPEFKVPFAHKEAEPYDPPIHFGEMAEDPMEEKQGQFVFEEEETPLPIKEEVPQPEPASEKTDAEASEEVQQAKYADYSNYKLPNVNRLLDRTSSSRGKENEVTARNKGRQLIDILDEFSIRATLQETYIGPSVTKFVIKPESGVKVNKILNIQDNIKMELAAKDIRIEAPIPGRNGVGIEIPNQTITPVHMRELFDAIPADQKDKKLLIALGKDLFGNPVFGELDHMPHLLVAGSTGSGKSVCMNAIICSLLLRTTPAELKLLLIDPKKVEFTQYATVPHLLGPVITDCSKAAMALQVIVNRMDERYNEFSRVGVRKISEYNAFVKKGTDPQAKPMPYIVVIIDELADLMTVAGNEVQGSIQRITQLARAAGIHLVVATQRPSVNVITGTIKTNIPSRIAFTVASAVDSRTILDQSGAEHLLGRGDMLYIPMGEPAPMRVQGVFVTDQEVERITQYVSSQAKPYFEDEFVMYDVPLDQNGFQRSPQDPMYDEVVTFVVHEQKASTSLLQRRFGFGYNRAAKIIDMLQMQGIIGPAQGSKPREVFKKPEDLE